MSNLRQAAQQALEALTAHADLHGTMYLKMDAINALRAALAEPNKCTHGVTDRNCKECYMAEHDLNQQNFSKVKTITLNDRSIDLDGHEVNTAP